MSAAVESKQPLIFALQPHPLADTLTSLLGGELGVFDTRAFPDGESYLRIESLPRGRPCVVLVDLAHPNAKYLPLLFLLETLRELGASSVGLIAPYLAYMRQDRRFHDGEAVTSRIFARSLSHHIDWLVTVDPHLHRYHALEEIYSVPCAVVQGAPALAGWLKQQRNVFLVGPDAESEQWVSEIAAYSGHDYIIGEKQRYGDRDVRIELPELGRLQGRTAVIVDDVISSGQTILQCFNVLKSKGIDKVLCVAVHGIFADNVDKTLLDAGLSQLLTTNTIPHASNAIDVTPQLLPPLQNFLNAVESTT